MGNEKGNLAPLGEDDSRIQASDSIYSLPEEAREALNEWLFVKMLKKYRQMKKLNETADADAVAFEGDVGANVAFVERDATEADDTELEDFGGVPAC